MSDDLSGPYVLRHQGRYAPDESWADAMADKIIANREEEEASKDPIQRKKGEAVERVKAGGKAALDVAHGVIEAPAQIAGGAVDAVNMLITDVDMLDEWLESAEEDPEAGTARKVISKVYDFISTGSGQIPRPDGEERPEAYQFPTTSEADSVTGGFVRNAARFVVAFAGAGKVTKGIKAATGVARVGKAALQGAMADFAIFDGHEGRLSDLLVQYPALQNPVTEYLATDMEDSELKGRLKNVVEGGPLGVLVDGLVLGIRAIRSHRAARSALEATDEVPAGAVAEDAVPTEPPVRAVGQELADLLDDSPTFSQRPKPATLDMEPAGSLTPDDILGQQPRVEPANEYAITRHARDGEGFEYDLYRGVGEADTSLEGAGSARLGTGGQYYTDSERAAGIYAEFRPEGSVVSERVRLRKPFTDELYDDTLEARFAEPEYQKLDALLREEGVGSLAQHDRSPLGSFVSASRALAKKYGERGMWAGSERMRALVEEAGFDGVVSRIRDLPEMPNHTEVMVFGKTPAPHATIKLEGDEMFVNWRRINSEDEVKGAIQETANAQKSVIDEATGGEVVTHEQTKLDAAHQDAWDVMLKAGKEKGINLNRSETLALRTLWVSSGKKLVQLAREARDRPSVAAQFAYRRHMALHNTIQKQALTVRREQARSLNQWAIPAGSDNEMMRTMQQMVEFGGGDSVTKDMADRLLTLVDSGNISKAEEFVRASTWAKTKHALTSAWYFSLLSGPKTHLRNLVSNTAAAVLQLPERKAANIIGQILGEESVARGETMEYFFGQIEGAVEALRITAENGRLKASGNVYRSWRTGEQGIGRGKVEMPPAGAFSADQWELDPQTLQGRAADMLDTFMSTTTRALVAADELYSTMGFRAELRAQAHRQVTQEVRAGTIADTPEAIKDRFVEILSDPEETIRIASQDHASYVTFTQPMGKIATNVTKLANCHPFFSPIARAVLPFRRVSANIPKYAFARSPAALLMRDTFLGEIKKGGAARDLALGRMAVGTSIMLAATDFAISGAVTGAGPADPQQRATLRRTGWMPYSLRIPTGPGEDDYRYFSVRGMEPLAHAFLIPAGIVEILKHVEWGEYDTDIEELGLATVLSIANHATNATYLSGISGAVAALHDHRMYGEGYFRRLAGTLIPTGVAQAAQADDPVKREIESMLDKIRSRIPGLSKDLPISRDAWGRPISYVSGISGWYDAVSPIYSKEYKPEPIDKELLELEHYVGRPRKNVHFGGELLGAEAPLGAERESTSVDMSQFPKAYERYVQLQGNGVKYTQHGSPIDYGGKGLLDTLNDLVTGKHHESFAYDQATRDEKAATIDTLRRNFQAAARAQVLQEFPELKHRVMDELRSSRGVIQ